MDQHGGISPHVPISSRAVTNKQRRVGSLAIPNGKLTRLIGRSMSRSLFGLVLGKHNVQFNCGMIYPYTSLIVVRFLSIGSRFAFCAKLQKSQFSVKKLESPTK